MMSTTGLNASNNFSYNNLSKYPFTPTQWQELEQQALIYKYMSSGIPIPSDLLLPIKRSSFNNFFPHPPPTMVPTWSCYQQLGGGGGGGVGYNSSIGIGRRAAEDPEPGRCRRTDGKKWRCSKEAYPNSKYCERHMHRGKNRSRKPVETPAITPSSSSLNITNPAAISSNSSSYPFCYPYSSPTHSDYSSWELRPLGLGEPRQRREEEKEKHCFVLGTDFKQEHQRQAVKERDFFDGWTSTSTNTNTNTSQNQKSKGLPWMGFDHHQGDSSTTQGPSSAPSYSKTQLTISIPMGLHDFPQ